MNGLNQIIAQGGRQLQLESPLNQFAQVETIRQAQQTNALRQAQMQELERGRSRTNALNQAYADAFDATKGTFDQSKLIQNLATGGLGSEIPTVQKGLREAREAELKTEKLGTESVLKRIELSRTQLEGINDLPGYIDWSMSRFQDPVLGPAITSLGSTPDKVMERIRTVGATPGGLSQLIEESKLGSQNFANLVKEREGQEITVRGQDIQAQTTRRGQNIQAETTRRGQDITERRERDLALAENIAAAKARGKVIAENKVAAEQALPGALATAEQTLTLIDEMIGDAKVEKGRIVIPKGGRRPAPGFEGYVGSGFTANLDVPFMRFVEGSDVAGYERRQLQVEGKTFLEAYESLRGGGAITVIEGAKGEQAISRMNKAQSEVEYIKAARELQEVVRKGVDRARAKVGAGGAAAPAAPAAPAGAMNPAMMSNEELLRQLGM
jgi:hypothetical protein